MLKIKKFPNTFTILFFLIAFFAMLTYILPAGKYTREMNEQLGREVPLPGSFQIIESSPQGFFDTLMAPISGFYDPISGVIGAIDVSLFVLMVGGFLGIVTKTGAIDTGIARIMVRLKGKEIYMIPILMILFALGGTSYGMAEESLAFYGLLIPIFMTARFNPLVAVAVIFVGTGIGTLGSTINPFGTVIASNAASVDFLSGVELRFAILAIALVVGIGYVMRYAKKVQNNPESSLLAHLRDDHEQHFLGNKDTTSNLPVLTGPQQAVLVLFILTFTIMIYGVSVLGWWMAEMATLFIFMGILCGIVGRLSEDDLINSFVAGAADLIGVALIVGVARGIVVVMEAGNITDTILNYAEGLVAGKSSVLFINTVYGIEMLLSFIVPSTSGLAVMSMPILAPLSDFANTGRELVVTAFMSGIGTVLFVTPTYGVLMGGLAIARIPYVTWLKFIAPLVAFFVALNCIILSIGVTL
ncbi:C4-dicarboxylate ABC transporter [Photobacterium gaetbulicola]|uniref:C4-dicarboxylate ABC transporter n=1 Tax=Photobacterium gaetbulicola TaxID=1295392 RepID=A0A0B9G9A8_9GAMM|nr:YfcC family protein [Photobacterium gaetbulicola]KHT65248.1 C4-dicarboxylate ABC transporter [Photobacterium gaetbulicola]